MARAFENLIDGEGFVLETKHILFCLLMLLKKSFALNNKVVLKVTTQARMTGMHI